MNAAPELDVDIYADALLADSDDLWARIRDAGPVVWLPRHRMYAIGRFADARAALRDDTLFRSGRGVGANPIVNLLGRDTTLNSDDTTHTTRRKVLMRSLGAKALTGIEDVLADEAQTVVGDLIRRGDWFEATRDFASQLPVRVVSELVGVRGGSEQMLKWAAATFDLLGPLNRRSLRSLRTTLGLFLYSQTLRPSAVEPGSWAASVFEAQRSGELNAREARALVIDFVAPSLDTTILATTHLLAMLGRNPEAWEAIRANPSLIPSAVVENVRLASPIRGFTRTLARSHAIDGVELPEGARVVVLFAAANRDETRYPDPGRFDPARPDGAHLGWGNGPHTCVGIHLAKLELRKLLEAMVPVVSRVDVGEPTALRNNTLQGIARMPARFV